MFTTPKLLEALCEKISLKKAGITGVFCGGTEMTRQFHRFAREELLEGADFAPTYGNTLMGLACDKPFDPADDYSIIYHAPQPRAVLQVVDPDHPDRLVEYGQWGRVKLTTLTKEFFVPGFLERDEAIRTPPVPVYPWDGVADVRPFRSWKSTWWKACIDASTVPIFRARPALLQQGTLELLRLRHRQAGARGEPGQSGA